MRACRFLLSTALLGLSLPALAADKSGEEVYNQTCIVCHGTGLLGAPKLSDGKRWGKLVAEGLDELIPAALAGERQMPPKGNNPNLSDLEVARAVIWMSNQHGGKFAEPSVDQMTKWRAKADRKKRKTP